MAKFALQVAMAIPATMLAAIIVVMAIETPVLIALCKDRRAA